jgi:hypothetical protein
MFVKKKEHEEMIESLNKILTRLDERVKKLESNPESKPKRKVANKAVTPQ